MSKLPNLMPELLKAQQELGLSDTQVAAAAGISAAAWSKAKKRGVIPKFEAAIKAIIALKRQDFLIDFLEKSKEH